MIGLLLVSHGELCEYLLKSTSMLAGEAEQCKAVSLNKGETPQCYEQRVRKAIEELDTGEGVIVLVDILGGTPYNTIGSLSREYNLKIITGMNMPMLVYLTLERNENMTIEDLIENASETAKNSIKVLQRK